MLPNPQQKKAPALSHIHYLSKNAPNYDVMLNYYNTFDIKTGEYTITLKMADLKRSDFYLVFSIIFCVLTLLETF